MTPEPEEIPLDREEEVEEPKVTQPDPVWYEEDEDYQAFE